MRRHARRLGLDVGTLCSEAVDSVRLYERWLESSEIAPLPRRRLAPRILVCLALTSPTVPRLWTTICDRAVAAVPSDAEAEVVRLELDQRRRLMRSQYDLGQGLDPTWIEATFQRVHRRLTGAKAPYPLAWMEGLFDDREDNDATTPEEPPPGADAGPLRPPPGAVRAFLRTAAHDHAGLRGALEGLRRGAAFLRAPDGPLSAQEFLYLRYLNAPAAGDLHGVAPSAGELAATFATHSVTTVQGDRVRADYIPTLLNRLREAMIVALVKLKGAGELRDDYPVERKLILPRPDKTLEGRILPDPEQCEAG